MIPIFSVKSATRVLTAEREKPVPTVIVRMEKDMRHDRSPFLKGSKMNTTEKIKRTCAVAMFCALAYICVFAFRLVNIGGFLTFDAKDAVITVGALFFGPVSGLFTSLAVTFLEAITISTTGPWGFLMNFLSSAAFSVTASLIYKHRRKMSGAVLGLLASVTVTTALMVLANLFITPLYLGVSRSDVAAMLPTLLLPFNFLKSLLNASLVMLLYKPITTALKRSRLIRDKGTTHTVSKRLTVLSTALAFLILAGCIAALVLVWGGKFSLWK